jgi:hypothetical protein
MRTNWIRAATLAGCAVTALGCSREAQVQSELPIVRVVVYRNGVAYFERSGHVGGESVRFKMRQGEVGDFLATLAVMEQGGSSVRAAAFPLQDEKAKESQDSAMRTVVLSLDGRTHDLQVGYVAAAPVWRPSYRLVVLPNGEAELQAWGIIENLSGEDWSGVALSLVAGAPLAFEAQLGKPVIPERPVVTDSGEVIASMPKGEASLRDRDGDGIPDAKDALDQTIETKPATPPPPPAAPPAGSASAAPSAAGDAEQTKTAAGEARPAATEGKVEPSAPRNVTSLAAVAAQAGSTRYDIPATITVPDKSATMVMLLARRMRGEALYLFSPDSGVPDSRSHPFHVARFENGTPGVLERGPIAVFQQGSFLGQGLLDPLPAAAWATVPFALERAVGVEQDRKTDVQGTRLAKIENGVLWIERDSVLKTTYRIQNGSDTPAKLLVKHPRLNAARLHEPPAGTEDNVGSGSALVPTLVPAHGKQELVVDERSAEREYADWFGAAAEKAVTGYMSDKRASATVVKELAAAWPLRSQIVSRQDERGKVQQELAALRAEASEKRADLQAIEKNRAADALRKTLTVRLTALAARTDVLSAQNIQLGQDLSELQVRWREAIRAIVLDEPLPPAPGR